MKYFSGRTTEEERSFEKKHILSQLDKYLATDVLEKVENDNGYRAKVDLLEKKIGACDGLILDIGSNTAGECEYLVSRGYSVIATDINEHALSISQKRCDHFGHNAPSYVACDGAHLPFQNESISCVVFNESLHHMPVPVESLREACRVLKPGGRVIMFEPYAYDPWRRISEVRDYFKGTIEKSFSERQLRRLGRDAGLTVTELSRVVLPPSTRKLNALPLIRRVLRVGYFWLRKTMPKFLGMIYYEAQKAGDERSVTRECNVADMLTCPKTHIPLKKTDRGYLSAAIDTPIGYPIVDGIPVLIPSEMFTLSKDEWQKAVTTA